MSRIFFTSGNYTVIQIDKGFEIGSRGFTKSNCKHLDHFVGKQFEGSFCALEDAIKACTCLASKSLKRHSGEILSNDSLPKNIKPKYETWIDDDQDYAIETPFAEFLEAID